MRTYAPLAATHPIITEELICPGCKRPFKVGDVVTLVCIGPGDDEEERAKAQAGRPYVAVGLPVHADCADPSA